MTAVRNGFHWRPHGELPASGQLLRVPAVQCDWVYFALASAAGTEITEIDETVWLHYRNGVDQEHLRSLAAESPFGAGSLVARVGVPRRDQLVALRLPDAPDLRVRAIAYVGHGEEGNS